MSDFKQKLITQFNFVDTTVYILPGIHCGARLYTCAMAKLPPQKPIPLSPETCAMSERDLLSRLGLNVYPFHLGAVQKVYGNFYRVRGI